MGTMKQEKKKYKLTCKERREIKTQTTNWHVNENNETRKETIQIDM